MPLKRKKEKREPKKLFLIVCEGEKTEPHYFNVMVDKLKTSRRISSKSDAIVFHGKHTDPLGVLNDLINYQKDGSKYTDFDQKWIVIDRDERSDGKGGHPKDNFDNALKKSEAKGVEAAWSNPCFEIWFLLHFEYMDVAIDRKAVTEKLKTKDKLPDYEKGAENIYNLLEPKIYDAIRNAKKLESESTSKNSNPGTTVHKLVEKLLNVAV